MHIAPVIIRTTDVILVYINVATSYVPKEDFYAVDLTFYKALLRFVTDGNIDKLPAVVKGKKRLIYAIPSDVQSALWTGIFEPGLYDVSHLFKYYNTGEEFILPKGALRFNLSDCNGYPLQSFGVTSAFENCKTMEFSPKITSEENLVVHLTASPSKNILYQDGYNGIKLLIQSQSNRIHVISNSQLSLNTNQPGYSATEKGIHPEPSTITMTKRSTPSLDLLANIKTNINNEFAPHDYPGTNLFIPLSNAVSSDDRFSISGERASDRFMFFLWQMMKTRTQRAPRMKTVPPVGKKVWSFAKTYHLTDSDMWFVPHEDRIDRYESAIDALEEDIKELQVTIVITRSDKELSESAMASKIKQYEYVIRSKEDEILEYEDLLKWANCADTYDKSPDMEYEMRDVGIDDPGILLDGHLRRRDILKLPLFVGYMDAVERSRYSIIRRSENERRKLDYSKIVFAFDGQKLVLRYARKKKVTLIEIDMNMQVWMTGNILLQKESSYVNYDKFVVYGMFNKQQ